MRPADTSPEAWRVYLDVLRRLPQQTKLRQCLAMSEMSFSLAKQSIREKFPRAGEREVFLRSVRIRLGRSLFEKAYGAFPYNNETQPPD